MNSLIKLAEQLKLATERSLSSLQSYLPKPSICLLELLKMFLSDLHTSNGGSEIADENYRQSVEKGLS